MNVRIYAVIFGIIFLAIGILGFFPTFTPNGYVFSLFNANPAHNIFHIVTGFIALIVAYSAHASRVYFRVFGVIFLFLACLALLVGNNFIFTHFNHADNLLHLIAGAIYIYLGFGKPGSRSERPLAEAGTVRPRERINSERIDKDKTQPPGGL